MNNITENPKQDFFYFPPKDKPELIHKNKFLVFNTDYLQGENIEECKELNNALKIVNKFYNKWRKKEGKTKRNKYWVVNKDEPYSESIKAIIKHYEEKKGNHDVE